MIAAVIALTSLSFGANAQAFATATATATIVSPISIVKNVDMNFGNLTISGPSGGTVTLEASAAATRTPDAGGLQLPTIVGTVSAAQFTVSGEPNYAYSIILPTSATLNGASSDMTADNFTTDVLNGDLGASGSESFYVGADLHAAANQAAGVYVTSAPFTVIVNYN